ncbi:hypothetical protein [uncultured Paraglaciecola sp.]|uniref:hypothetical protein n=1 Tax=uncultured Paraglaciecola sp. TaxID=1765024 RepID=UPI0026219B1E|nr:hypothetical protein [uncultured Paraglaciecola sp.]
MSDSIQEIWTAKQEEKLHEIGKAFDNTAELYRKIALQEKRIVELEEALNLERKRLHAMAFIGEREYVLMLSEMKVSGNNPIDVAISNIDELITIKPFAFSAHPLLKPYKHDIIETT